MPEGTSDEMEAERGQGPRRKGTSTSNFGVGRRESHDASGFYARFGPLPKVSTDRTINKLAEVDRIYLGDSKHMTHVDCSSIALVVTSPPYFAGKEYEEALGEGHVPGTYVEYLKDLEEVFAECVRVLEPGGRLAVNVANLGRRPYRSLSADVIAVLQDRLNLLLRGEIIWQKGKGAAGSCAWGSFQSAQNPVLRDISERVIIASKGRFDRALTRRERQRRNLPFEASMSKEAFMEPTLDVWEFPAERATRVGHPAPFPVELPKRLIDLYTYYDDVVLDPFMGSGTTAVAALRADRHYVGYETDSSYIEIANRRIAEERDELSRLKEAGLRREVRLGVDRHERADEPFQARAVRQGKRAKEIAREVLEHCGFRDIVQDHRFMSGVEINFAAVDGKGRTWYFDVSGAFTSTRPGLRRTDTLWKALGKAAVLKEAGLGAHRLVFLSTDLPPKGSSGDAALRAVRGTAFHDAIEMLSEAGQDRLRRYGLGEGYDEPIGDLLSPAE
ncbi:MAG: site-specific DNA-methyltransferase [Actinomycetota bacterium]|nr:site-specific DNA-methyltransferase [Actinomycetota bacterium]